MVYKKFECKKCGYLWFPRNPNNKPLVCPKCKSYKWMKNKDEK